MVNIYKIDIYELYHKTVNNVIYFIRKNLPH